LAALLSDQKAVWEKANSISPTLRTWEQEEVEIRAKYAELAKMPQEDRDLAITQGHLEKTGMLESVLKHINNVLLPIARANESRSIRRSKKKRSKKKKRGKR
jgi:hypothetical protein